MVLGLKALSLGLGKRAPAERATLPPGERIYAIGDIHGCRAQFEDLLAQIDIDDARRGPAKTRIILLGDLVDRGPDSCGVVAKAMDLAVSGRDVRFLKGNHEEMFLAAIESDKSEPMRFFLRNGGKETLLSYPISPEEFDHGSLSDLRALAHDRVPQSHRDFLAGFEKYIVVGDYLFVHAGIRPGIPLNEQREEDLRWIRAGFLDSKRDHGMLVVHGHSITDEVDSRPNRIGIDTGAFASGVLTAIGIEGDSRWFLATEGVSTGPTAGT